MRRGHNLVGAHTVITRKVMDEHLLHVKVQHFHPWISAGDLIRWNARAYDVDWIRTYYVLTNIPHIEGIWWADLVALQMPIRVLGRTYWSSAWTIAP